MSPQTHAFELVAKQLGVLLAQEKEEGPTPCITFLGIQIDMEEGILALPPEKLKRIQQESRQWGQRHWCRRCELELCYFAAYLVQEGLAPASNKVYLVAVHHMQVLSGFPEPREISSLPRLKLVLNRISRSRVGAGSLQRPRLPITMHILKGVFTTLWQQPPTFNTTVLWAACSVCSFGFFRAGEITVPTKHGFNPRSHLTWGDVSVDNIREPSCIKFHLRISKCEQLGRGVDVFIGRVNDPICPVVACSWYIALNGPRPGPFFWFEDGSPLTKACFVQLVKEVVSEMGLDAELYSGHSFRIGAATTAAQAGITEATIKALVRWSSSAFLLYVQTPRSRLAELLQKLAHV